MIDKGVLKTIIGTCMLILLLSAVSVSVLATDLPINPGEITGQRTERQPAVTARRGIDLFGDASTEIADGLARRRENLRTDAQDTLFNYPFANEATVPRERVLSAVQESGLFNEPMRFTRGLEHEAAEDGIPLWITISVVIGAAIIGFLIAKGIMSKTSKAEGKS